MLTGVTFTGADDSNDIAELIDFSRQYPFVEWGILFGSHPGGARFPSDDWVSRLVAAVADSSGVKVRLSAHLCGKYLRHLLDSGTILPIPDARRFERAQLNFHGAAMTVDGCNRLCRVLKTPEWFAKEVIVQLDGVNDWILSNLLAADIRASGLYDTSHGAGEKPKNWPKPNANWDVGYAGGLGPETIIGDLRAIKDAAGDQRFWIDMETKVRSFHRGMSHDVFDIELCRSVCDDVRREFQF